MNLLRNGLVLAGFLIIVFGCIAAPVAGAEYTIDNSTTISATIAAAAPGDTVINLKPGTYFEHDITLSRNLIIRASRAFGGTAATTIIDAGNNGRIFYNSGGYSLTIDTLTLQDGRAPYGLTGPIGGSGLPGGDGGAVYSTGPVTVTGSTITGCSAGTGGAGGPGDTARMTGGDGGDGGNGGAVYTTGSLTLASTTISNCHAGKGGIGGPGGNGVGVNGGDGGDGGDGGNGGAVYATGPLSVTGSSFTECRAGTGGTGGAGGDGDPLAGSAGSTGEAGSGGAIRSSGTATISSSGFTGCDGYVAGGAVASSGPTTVTGSTFSYCFADYGGALASLENSLSVNSSTFTSCQGGFGGAISSGTENTGSLSVESCTFTRCYASYGGAVASMAGTVAIASSQFSDCYGIAGGAVVNGLMAPSAGALSITTSSFENCLGMIGGAVFSITSAPTTITSSGFNNCTGLMYGGGIMTMGDTAITDSRFTNCSLAFTGFGSPAVLSPPSAAGLTPPGTGRMNTAFDGTSLPPEITSVLVSSTGSPTGVPPKESPASPYPSLGGAILFFGGNSVVTGTTIANCGAVLNGGGIGVGDGASLDITSSSITDCSALDHGGAVFNDNGTVTIRYSRIYHDDTGTAVWNNESVSTGTLDARYNWWGSNDRPLASVGPDVDYEPWLVLGMAAAPSPVMSGQTSRIQACLTATSDGADTSGGGIFVPDNIRSRFALVSGSGTLSPRTAGTSEGIAVTTYSPDASGTATISATVDDQTVYLPLLVLRTPPVPTRDTSGNDDDGPSALVPSATGTPVTDPLMTVTVNIGGNSKAGKATVTGTKLSGLVVTGILQPGPGTNVTALPGVVYQYLTLTPAGYATITGAVINFTVPQSWLDENHIAPGSIVLYRQTATGWEALPTTQLNSATGTVSFSAQSPGFSLFAIAGAPGVLTPPGIAQTPGVSGSAAQEQAAVPTTAPQVPVTTRTTAPPATAAQPSGPSPVTTIILVIGAMGVLTGGGFLARRWWIRRQNPALFEDY